MARLDDEFESVLESTSSSLDMLTDNAMEEDAEIETEASIIVDDVLDKMLDEASNGDNIDKEVQDTVDAEYAAANLISDSDIDQIAKGKKVVDDDEEGKADADVKAYAKEVVESGNLTEDEVDRIFSGDSVEEILYSESEGISDEPGEIFSTDDSDDDFDPDSVDTPDRPIVNTDPNRDISSPGDRMVYHDDDDKDDEECDKDSCDSREVKFDPYNNPDEDNNDDGKPDYDYKDHDDDEDDDEDDDHDDDEDDDEDDDHDDDEDDEVEESVSTGLESYKEDNNMIDDIFDENFFDDVVDDKEESFDESEFENEDLRDSIFGESFLKDDDEEESVQESSKEDEEESLTNEEFNIDDIDDIFSESEEDIDITDDSIDESFDDIDIDDSINESNDENDIFEMVFDGINEADETLPKAVSGSEKDYSEDDGAGINSSEKNTGFLRGMVDHDEQKYGHPKKDKDILSTVPNLFNITGDPNVDDMKKG